MQFSIPFFNGNSFSQSHQNLYFAAPVRWTQFAQAQPAKWKQIDETNPPCVSIAEDRAAENRQ